MPKIGAHNIGLPHAQRINCMLSVVGTYYFVGHDRGTAAAYIWCILVPGTLKDGSDILCIVILVIYRGTERWQGGSQDRRETGGGGEGEEEATREERGGEGGGDRQGGSMHGGGQRGREDRREAGREARGGYMCREQTVPLQRYISMSLPL